MKLVNTISPVTPPENYAQENLVFTSSNVYQHLDSVIQNHTVCTIPDFILPKVKPMYPELVTIPFTDMGCGFGPAALFIRLHIYYLKLTKCLSLSLKALFSEPTVDCPASVIKNLVYRNILEAIEFFLLLLFSLPAAYRYSMLVR